MRVVWTAEQPATDVRQLLDRRGYDPARLGLPEDDAWRITRRFPVRLLHQNTG
jgi:hypothetical protein